MEKRIRIALERNGCKNCGVFLYACGLDHPDVNNNRKKIADGIGCNVYGTRKSVFALEDGDWEFWFQKFQRERPDGKGVWPEKSGHPYGLRDILYLVAPSRRPTFFDVSAVADVEKAVEFGGTGLELPVDDMVHSRRDGWATCDISPSRSKTAVASFYREVLNVDVWNLKSKKLIISKSWKLKTPGMWVSFVDFVDDSFFVVIAGNNFYCFGISNNKLKNFLTIDGDQKDPTKSLICGVGIRSKHNDYWYATFDEKAHRLEITLVPISKIQQSIRDAKLSGEEKKERH